MKYNMRNFKMRAIICVIVGIITSVLRKNESKKLLESEGWTYSNEDKKYHKEVGFAGIFDDDIMKNKLNMIAIKWSIIALVIEIPLCAIFKCNKVFDRK